MLLLACAAMLTNALPDAGYGNAGHNTKNHPEQSNFEGGRQGPVVWLGLGLGLRKRPLESLDLDPSERPGSDLRPGRDLGDRRRLGKHHPKGNCKNGCTVSGGDEGQGVYSVDNTYLGTLEQICPYGCGCEHLDKGDHCHTEKASHFPNEYTCANEDNCGISSKNSPLKNTNFEPYGSHKSCYGEDKCEFKVVCTSELGTTWQDGEKCKNTLVAEDCDKCAFMQTSGMCALRLIHLDMCMCIPHVQFMSTTSNEVSYLKGRFPHRCSRPFFVFVVKEPSFAE